MVRKLRFNLYLNIGFFSLLTKFCTTKNLFLNQKILKRFIVFETKDHRSRVAIEKNDVRASVRMLRKFQLLQILWTKPTKLLTKRKS